MPEEKIAEKVKYYTIKDAAKEAGVPVNRIRSAISAGKIITKKACDSSRYGYHHIIADYELLDWVEDPNKTRCEPVPSYINKTAKSKKAPTPKEQPNEDIYHLMEILVKKVEDYVYTDAYSKGYEAGKKEATEAIKNLLGNLE